MQQQTLIWELSNYRKERLPLAATCPMAVPPPLNHDSSALTPLAAVTQWLQSQAEQDAGLSRTLQSVPIADIAGRACGETILAPTSLPSFCRAMMDGVAIQASDHLDHPQEIWTVTTQREDVRQAVPVRTGMPLPENCDTVVPVERLRQSETALNSRQLSPGIQFQINGGTALSPGKHVAQVGEDIQQGQPVVIQGQRLGIQHIPLLAALGLTHVNCKSFLSVDLLITGNELLPSGSEAEHQIHDANGPTLSALVSRDASFTPKIQYLGDHEATLSQTIEDSTADLLIITCGTSVGAADYSVSALRQVGKVYFHGLAIRPGKPVAIGRHRQRCVFLLPGNPVACLFTYEILVRPYLQQVQQNQVAWPYRQQEYILDQEIQSSAGRVDFLRVGLLNNRVVPITSGQASQTSSLAHASGFLLIEADQTRLQAGETVSVFCFP